MGSRIRALVHGLCELLLKAITLSVVGTETPRSNSGIPLGFLLGAIPAPTTWTSDAKLHAWILTTRYCRSRTHRGRSFQVKSSSGGSPDRAGWAVTHTDRPLTRFAK